MYGMWKLHRTPASPFSFDLMVFLYGSELKLTVFNKSGNSFVVAIEVFETKIKSEKFAIKKQTRKIYSVGG